MAGGLVSVLLGWLLLLGTCFDATAYSIESRGVSILLEDARTGKAPVSTLFLKEATNVYVEGISWVGSSQGNATLNYKTFLNGEVAAEGQLTLNSRGPFELQERIHVGEIVARDSGKHSVRVELSSGEATVSEETEVHAFRPWIASIPIILAVLFTFFQVRVELSFVVALLVGSCIVEGSLVDGFKSFFAVYLIDAMSDESHIYM